ncbi:GPI-anchored surface protein, putative [Bodo saltans]|uniref:GPI-anchored surface protein, putative n=1 Tax=Bodo saltans TaxID=75058 RepID=A0A0S4KJQ4_BODSA|nr:GPI-anchored surface protein, putative [Bodo saltans]|eukprot:CUI15226.1 GPI-anchored surface protein, putative [Bodo saltans]
MPPTEKIATVLCNNPLLVDEYVFAPPQRHELEAIGNVAKALSLPLSVRTQWSMPTRQEWVTKPFQHRIAIAKAILQTESAISSVESLSGHSLSTTAALGDMESTLSQLSSENELTIKMDMQNLELKLDSLSRFCRQQKLISLPLESVRSAGEVLHLFSALNVTLAHVHEAVISLRSMSTSHLTSTLLSVDSSKAAVEFSNALLLATTLDLAEASMFSCEQRFEEFSAVLRGLVNSIAVVRA